MEDAMLPKPLALDYVGINLCRSGIRTLAAPRRSESAPRLSILDVSNSAAGSRGGSGVSLIFTGLRNRLAVALSWGVDLHQWTAQRVSLRKEGCRHAISGRGQSADTRPRFEPGRVSSCLGEKVRSLDAAAASSGWRFLELKGIQPMGGV